MSDPVEEVAREIHNRYCRNHNGGELCERDVKEVIDRLRQHGYGAQGQGVGPLLDSNALLAKIAQFTAHRVCCGTEHDPANGKLHGYCVVCGVPWPCEYASPVPSPESATREEK